jgi:adenylosuccinate lyase
VPTGDIHGIPRRNGFRFGAQGAAHTSSRTTYQGLHQQLSLPDNLDKFSGLVHSQRVLLALTQKGVSREDSYRLVQRNAMKVWEQGADFMAELKADPEVSAALSDSEIEEKFDLGYHTRHVDTIFARVFGEK